VIRSFRTCRGRERPSTKELWKKLHKAKQLIAEGEWYLGSGKLQEEFRILEDEFKVDLTLAEEQKSVLLTVLNEISANDYAGYRPPEESIELQTAGLEMFPFCWSSPFFKGVEMYFKFSLAGSSNEPEVLWIYSLHVSRIKNNVN
jgi:hypothetical protein